MFLHYNTAVVPPTSIAPTQAIHDFFTKHVLTHIQYYITVYEPSVAWEQVASQVEVVEGDPRTSLVDAVTRHHATLLVVGSRKMGPLQRYYTSL